MSPASAAVATTEAASQSNPGSPRVVSRLCAGECGGWIPRKRLEAKPNARLCVACQETLDVLPTEAPVDMARLHMLPRSAAADRELGHRKPNRVQHWERRGLLSTWSPSL